MDRIGRREGLYKCISESQIITKYAFIRVLAMSMSYFLVCFRIAGGVYVAPPSIGATGVKLFVQSKDHLPRMWSSIEGVGKE